MVAFRRRDLLLLAGIGATMRGRLDASDSDFWNKKPPADWTPEEIARLLNDSPWAKEITPTYTSLPPPTDHRPWNEMPPIGGGPISTTRKHQIKAPYKATIRWESAEPIRNAHKIALPAVSFDSYVIGILFRNASSRDLGAKPAENIKESALLVGNRPVAANFVQPDPKATDGFLVGFPKMSIKGFKQIEFSARVGFLALKVRFHTGEMLYRGQLVL
jgi:hypothetical protein